MSKDLKIDFTRDQMPEWVRAVIDEALAIEQEDAREAGSLGFMTRALVSATMPYKDPKNRIFERRNGDMTLTMLSPNGVPFGKYPRLLMSYLVTEAVTKRSDVIELGDTLALFLRSAINVKATGGKEGTQTRLSEQMKRLFTSIISVSQRSSTEPTRSFDFENITIVNRGSLDNSDMNRLDRLNDLANIDDSELWKREQLANSTGWNSRIELTEKFYQECIQTPVPIDLRAYKVLSDAPMAMDIYAWLTYRASYVKKATRPIPWPALQAQFGSGSPFTEQGARDFKKAFKKNLELVRLVYPKLRIDETSKTSGLILLPSPTHIPKSTAPKQTKLFE